jgi:hypothetical protein
LCLDDRDGTGRTADVTDDQTRHVAHLAQLRSLQQPRSIRTSRSCLLSYDQPMSLALSLYVTAKFNRAMEHCDNLVEVHQWAGSGTRGRRRIETSVNRAIIVIAVASWQAVVQDMTRFLLDRSVPERSDPNYGVAHLIHGQVMRALGNFSTPNAENTRDLLRSVGFDPRKYWTWSNGALGSREVIFKGADVEQQLREWLTVRHAIAHGDEKMPDVGVLQAVRQGVADRHHGHDPAIRRKAVHRLHQETH